MNKILVAFFILYATNINAAVMERPSKKYPDQAYKSYAWMAAYKKAELTISINDDAKNFINEDSLRRYLKLKMRNFLKEIELVENPKGLDYNYLYIQLELYKYNEKTGIHYGLISLKLDSAVDFSGNDERIYELTTSIAGSETQIVDFIKKEIDSMVEVYAEDYYFIDELHIKNIKPVN